MKSNNPITKTIEIITGYDGDGNPIKETKENILFDRLAIDLHCSANQTSDNSPIVNTIVMRVKRCSSDGWLLEDGYKSFVFPDISKCDNENAIIAFSKIEEIIQELMDKEGL